MSTKYLFIVVAFVLFPSTLIRAQEYGNSIEVDEKAIRQVIEYYFDGWKNNNVQSMKKAFHPKAKWFFVTENNGLGETSPATVYDNMRSNLRGQMPVRQVTLRIAAIDITGDGAQVKTKMEYPNTEFAEYLSLMRFNDEWKIVSRITSCNKANCGAAYTNQ